MSKINLFPIFLFFMSVFTFLTTAAQDTPVGCTADSLTALVAQIQEANGTAIEAIQAVDLTAAVEALSASDERVGLMKAACAGLLFEGADADVIGPVEIPEGIYRTTATTLGYMLVSVTVIDGECGAGSGSILSSGLFFLTEGDAADGAEAVFTSRGCTALLELKSITAPWTMAFEKLG